MVGNGKRFMPYEIINRLQAQVKYNFWSVSKNNIEAIHNPCQPQHCRGCFIFVG